jgi:hypothetical protein
MEGKLYKKIRECWNYNAGQSKPIEDILDKAKKELSLEDTCGYCEHQEYGCNNSEDCPRNIAFKKWFGDQP